jgi:hypothetical protein
VAVPEFVDVDPATLHVPPSRRSGADPGKLARQILLYQSSTQGMPPPWVVRCRDGRLQLTDGVTRATRAAKLAPGRLITVAVIEERPNYDTSKLPTIGDLLP